jgi:molybdopterin/thiamine biosynthesis adenylyltransferase
MLLPMVKSVHAAYRIAGGARIRIGGPVYGIAAEVEDPTGAVWTLLESMDGTRTVAEVAARVIAAHPDVSEQEVYDGVAQFVNAGYVENAGASDPAELTVRDRERYDRGREYFRWVDLSPRGNSWGPQCLLKRAAVTVVGVGGTGGAAAMALAASGVGRLHCVDADAVELSNLNRQVMYVEDDIGRPKAEAAVDRLRRLNSDIEVTGERAELRGVDDVVRLANACDVLLLAADRPLEVRTWTNRGCLLTGTPWVQAGYHGPLVTYSAHVPGDGACFECLQAAQARQRLALGAFPGDGDERGERVANAVTAPPAGISGQLAAHAVLSLITGAPPASVGRIHAVNLVEPDHVFVVDDPRDPDCPACGSLVAAR